MTAIARQPTTGDLAAYAVGRPVSAEHWLRACWDEGFLLGQNTQPIISQRFAYSSATSRTYRVSYTRNPGVSALLIEAEAHKGTAAGAAGTVTLTSSAGAISWISSTPSPFDGTAGGFTAHFEDTSARRKHRRYLDVTGLTVGTTYELLFAYVDYANSRGIAKLTILEVPVATTDPLLNPTTEIGIDAGQYYSTRSITSNGIASPRGMARLLAQIDKCRAQNKRQWQICTAELDAEAFQTNSGSYATLMAAHSAANPTWIYRARRVKRTSDNNVYVLGFRYRVSGGATASLQILVDGVATQATGLASATYTETTKALLIPCTGVTDQEVTIQFEGKITSGAGVVYMPRARFLENEP